ncbi:MAG: copper chaperone PCu(A)C [Pseudomonadota bacterium]
MRVLALSLLVLFSTPFASQAGDSLQHGDLTINEPWARATPPNARVGAGYGVLINTGNEPDRLLGGESAVSERIEIHDMKVQDGVMIMRPITDGLEIPAGGSVALKPGGYHIMFIGLNDGLKEGQSAKAILRFERAGAVEVTFPIAPVGAPGLDHSGHGHKKHDHSATN